MAKFATSFILDGLLDRVAACTQMRVCAGQPTNYADAITKTLATVTLDSGDFTKAAGDVSGRKVTVGQQSSLSITASGTADHVVLIDTSVSPITLRYGTTCTSQALTSGGTVTVPAFDIEVAAPS